MTGDYPITQTFTTLQVFGSQPGLADLELAIDVLLNGMDNYLAGQTGDGTTMDVLQAAMAYARTVRDASRTTRTPVIVYGEKDHGR
jgi:hypothetical protein